MKLEYREFMGPNPWNKGKLFKCYGYWTNNDYLPFPDIYHSDHGPTVVGYYNNQPWMSWYYKNDKLHRVDGPAVVGHQSNLHSYFLLGTHIMEKDFNTPGFVDAFILERS